MERARNNAYNSRQIGVRLKRLFCEKKRGIASYFERFFVKQSL